MRNLLLSVLVLAALACVCPRPAVCAPATAITDDFARYREGSSAEAGWETDGVGWEARGGLFESDGAGRTFAFPLAVPHARRLVVEATLRLRRPAAKEWKVAGVAVVRDEGNYWHFAVVEAPDADGRKHHLELTEMYNGKWLAQGEGATRLQATAMRGNSFDWQYDHPYRIRLAVTADIIEGTLSEVDGTECARMAYVLKEPAVLSGRPALTTGSLAAGFGAFRAEILEQAPAPTRPAPPAYACANPGPLRGKRTGFFHVEQVAGRWWLIDPEGNSFYAVGTDHVNYNAHWCEKLGYAPYHRNVEKKFGAEEKWAASATDRLKQWHFNTLGAGCGPSTRHRGLPHTAFLSLGSGFVATSDIAPRTTWTGFPNVLDPRFEKYCRAQAHRQCRTQRDDPWLLGYFLDNELEWYGKNGSETGLVDETFKKPADHSAKQALVAFLCQRYPTIGAFNAAWGAKAAGYDALAKSTEPITPGTPAGRRDCRDFVRLIAERYFAVTTAAIRQADPNHLILGCRFAGRAPDIWDIAGKYLDIVTVNYYGHVDLERGATTDMPQAMARYHAESQRPLMITEWSFPALDAGLPCQHGAGQRVPTQKEKARCYAIYQKTLFGLPYMVGSNYFMWGDEPELGISSTFPEDSNYGLVDVNDDTWQDLTRTATRVNPLAHALHSGQTAELSGEIVAGKGRAPAVVRVRNRGKVAARFPVRIWIQGAGQTHDVALDPGARREIPLPLSGPAFVAAEIDPEDTVVEADESDNHADAILLAGAGGEPAVVVANPSTEALRNVPVAVALGGARAPADPVACQVQDAAGRAVPAQIDRLPAGTELAFVAPEVPARSVAFFPLRAGAAPFSQVEDAGDRALVFAGRLRLEHRAGSGHLFDRVSIGDTLLGRYGVLVHQVLGQPLWVPPDGLERIQSHTGPVRTVFVITAALRARLQTEAMTAVDDKGTYAPQQRRAARYRATVRLNCYREEPWFGARVLRLENTDRVPWRCQSYFHYPVSAIGGKAEDDQSRGSGGTPMWYDAAAGASYGAVVNTTQMRAHFWKDTPDGAGEHADIWREVARDLKPGQTFEAGPEEGEVLLFGARGTPDQPGGEALARIRALGKIQVRLVGKVRK